MFFVYTNHHSPTQKYFILANALAAAMRYNRSSDKNSLNILRVRAGDHFYEIGNKINLDDADCTASSRIIHWLLRL